MKGLTIFDSQIAWPTTLVVGLMHGNEPIGFRFRDKLKEALRRHEFCWKILFLVGNPDAAELGIRFIQRDLNRSFGTFLEPDREILRAEEIRKFLSSFGKIDFAFDIHSTPTKSDPMIICMGDNISREVAKKFPLDRLVINLDKIIEWVPIGRCLLDEFGIPNLAFECGQHSDVETLKIADSIFSTILDFQNKKPSKFCGAKEIIYATNIIETSSREFTFVRNFRGFEPIAAGEIIAIEPWVQISFDTPKIMLIPRPDAIAELDVKPSVIVGYVGELG